MGPSESKSRRMPPAAGQVPPPHGHELSRAAPLVGYVPSRMSTNTALQGTQAWAKPSPRMWAMRKAELGLLTVLALAAGVAGAAGTGSLPGAIAALAGVALLAPFSLWVTLRRYRAWAYQEREDDLLVSRGVMFRRLSVVPYGRMQFVDVTAGPVERLFKLASVRLHTAAAASDARIPGLEQAEAARLRDRLAALGEARAAGL
jgi:membrane protein YdbS with pleckstrin-like domain